MSKCVTQDSNRMEYASEVFPAIFLSEKCDVTDVSESFKSCCGKTASRTLLMSSMDSDSFSTLESFCKSHYSVTADFPLTFGKYTHSVAYKLSYKGTHVTALYLAGSKHIADIIKLLLKGDLTEKIFVMMNVIEGRIQDTIGTSAFRDLTSDLEEIDSFEAHRFITAITAKIMRRKGIISSSVNISPAETAPRTVMGFSPAVLCAVLTSALTVLDTISTDGEIHLSFTATDDLFETQLSANVPGLDRVLGRTDNIMALSELIPGSLANLAVIVHSVVGSEMYIELNHTSDRLTFHFGKYAEALPYLEFKFRDPLERADELLDAMMKILRSTCSSQSE